MINLDNLVKKSTKADVQPSNNIFRELGNNTYDYKDILSELIDNSIAAIIPGKVLNIEINIIVDKTGKALEFIFSDDASGIPDEMLGKAITPAGIQTKDSLNEHGLGMKQAIAALGELNYLATKTKVMGKGTLIREFKFGEIDTYETDFPLESGTIISVVNLKPIVITHQATVTRTIIPYLGARYRSFLKTENRRLNLTLNLINQSTNQKIYAGSVIPISPVYFHPSTRENRPVILKHKLSGNGWEAFLTFGYAPREDAEYEELGLIPPTKFDPYKVTLHKQGLDILLHDRVILFHQLSELEIISQKHNDYNNVRGEIILSNGFQTAITKNSIIHDTHFFECIQQIKAILNGEKEGPGNRKIDYLKRNTFSDELPEKLLRDRLMEWLKTNPVDPKKSVESEFVLQGIEGYIDILADEVPWELKTDQANALSIYQLFMYMDIGGYPKGFLVAKSFTTGARIAQQKIKELHNKDITLATLDKFPINSHPTDKEREDYY